MTKVTLLSISAALAVTAAALAPAAMAQEAGYLAEFERPYGWDYGTEDRPYDGTNTRDELGNRVVINGLINGGSSLGSGLYTGWGQTDGASGMIGSGMAVGNQLNVITNGSFNTIIIDSTQINTGDQTVVLTGGSDE
ncbi:MAG: holdfast anchoring protein HfaA [Hyphomonas sp.]|uniref:holdfast anchoring protein HfaA n=1 Tax=Hyphomonas sp. TaxID=87 RepID=UPI0035279EF1